MRRMSRAVTQIQAGVYARLWARYASKHDEATAGYLAAAVTNHVFHAEPTTAEAQRFLEQHPDLVRQEALSLAQDPEICRALTDAVRVMAVVTLAQSGPMESAVLGPVNRLTELGLLVPGGTPPAPGTFIPFAERFYRDAVSAAGRSS